MGTVAVCYISLPRLLHTFFWGGQTVGLHTKRRHDHIFLIHHLALETFWIEGDPSFFESWPVMSAQIPMPNLQRLRAPRKFLPAITDTRLKEKKKTLA